MSSYVYKGINVADMIQNVNYGTVGSFLNFPYSNDGSHSNGGKTKPVTGFISGNTDVGENINAARYVTFYNNGDITLPYGVNRLYSVLVAGGGGGGGGGGGNYRGGEYCGQPGGSGGAGGIAHGFFNVNSQEYLRVDVGGGGGGGGGGRNGQNGSGNNGGNGNGGGASIIFRNTNDWIIGAWGGNGGYGGNRSIYNSNGGEQNANANGGNAGSNVVNDGAYSLYSNGNPGNMSKSILDANRNNVDANNTYQPGGNVNWNGFWLNSMGGYGAGGNGGKTGYGGNGGLQPTGGAGGTIGIVRIYMFYN